MTVITASRTDAITALKCELAADVLRLSGSLRLQVTGWSMLPSVLPGDMLIIERTQGRQISKGDIVLFHRDGRLFAHRVVAKAGHADDEQSLQITTRGDGMAWPDPVVCGSALLGKVNFIVRKGMLIEPRRSLSFSQRVVAGLVRHSSSAARVVAGIHGMRRNLPEADGSCPI